MTPCKHENTWQLERYSDQDECVHAVLWCSDCGALKNGLAWRLPAPVDRHAELERRARELCTALDWYRAKHHLSAAIQHERGVAQKHDALAELLGTGAEP